MNFELYVEKYLAFLKRKAYSNLTIDSYRREIDQFTRFLTAYYPRITAPKEVKREIIVDYQDYLGERHTPTGEARAIVAAGRVSGDGEGSPWRVATLADLGMACRLAAISGLVDVVYDNGSSDYSALRCNLSGREDLLTETLLY